MREAQARLFYILFGTLSLWWGFRQLNGRTAALMALLLGIFAVLALREGWLGVHRLALFLAFGLAGYGVLTYAPGGWMMLGILGYATFSYFARQRADLPRDPLLRRRRWQRLGLLHLLVFLLATLFAGLEGTLSPWWYLAWAVDFAFLILGSRSAQTTE